MYNSIKCKYCFKMLSVDIFITVSRCIYKPVIFDFLTYRAIILIWILCVFQLYKVFLFFHVVSAENAI